MTDTSTTNWVKVLDDPASLPEGRVMTVTAGTLTFALTHFDGTFAALDNRCPHQGGPLGEGSIENGCLRSPWHGWDFHPTTGKSPGSFDDGVDTYPCEVREDGVYVQVPCEAMHIRTHSDVIAETLANCGVQHVFGMVGHSNLGMADAIRRLEAEGRMQFIGIRHEGAAAFAASAYGKLTGRPAASFAIAGPGATNLLTGLWDAKVDRSPVVALTGQVDLQVLGPGAFQEVDLANAFEAVSVFSHTVYATSKHAELATLAVKNATVERQVAHLILPNEVQEMPASEEAVAGSLKGRVSSHRIRPDEETLEEAVALLKDSQRPVIIVGFGARFEMESVMKLAEQLNAPVLTTFKGKGLLPDAHPLAGGVLGRSGTPVASYLMNESDSLLVLGASFSNHTGITPKRKTIQVDTDRMTLGKFHAVDVPVWGEIGLTSDLLREGVSSHEPHADRREEIAERWRLWKEEKRSRMQDSKPGGIASASVFATMNDLIQENAVIAVDVGNNTYSFGRYFEPKQQSVLMSGYLGSIGFGYPAAMGAWAAAPDRPTWCVTGDGGFGQYLAEVTTAVKYGMNITHILLRNNELGKISKEQKAGAFEVWATSLQNPDFSQFVTNCGGLGIQVRDAVELEAAIREARDYPGPATVEIFTDAALV